MSGPAKLNENSKIQRRPPLITDDFFFATNGFGGVAGLSALLSLLSSTAPNTTYTDITALLENTSIGVGYFALVLDATDDPNANVYGLYIYQGPTRSNLSSYALVATMNIGSQTLEDVLVEGNDGGGNLIKNIGDGIDPNDAVTLTQLESAVAAVIQHYKGLYASSGALAAAHPSALPGDYAYVDAGVGQDVQIWIWDDDDDVWKQGGSAIVAWTTASAGVVERSTTAEAQNIVTRALAGSSDSSNSDARTPSEKGLVEMLLSFIAAAWTWAAQQTFSIGMIISDASTNTQAMFNASKKIVSNAALTLADYKAGTDTIKYFTAAGFVSFRTLVRTAVTMSGGVLALDLSDSREKRFYVTTANAVSSAFALVFANETDAEQWELYVPITGTVAMTVPSSVLMGNDWKVAGKWNDSTKVYTFAGATASYFKVTFARVSSTVIHMQVSLDYLI